jgi:hypothetical protein
MTVDDGQNRLSETEFKRKELLVQQESLALRKVEVELKRVEIKRAKWNNAMSVAIVTLGLVGLANIAVIFHNGRQDDRKAEQARVLEALKAHPDQAAKNLQFLLEMGLVADDKLREKLSSLLKKRVPGEGPSLEYSGYTTDRSSSNTTYSGFTNPNVDVVNGGNQSETLKKKQIGGK